MNLREIIWPYSAIRYLREYVAVLEAALSASNARAEKLSRYYDQAQVEIDRLNAIITDLEAKAQPRDPKTGRMMAKGSA